MAKTSGARSSAVSDAAVRAKTGKGWIEWFTILDRARCSKMNHREIVAILVREGVSGWWQQMIAVAYEQERGLRERHEKPDGFAISRSKTIAADVERLYAAWSDAQARRRWLGESGLTIRKSTPGRSMRITWPDGTHVDVMFYAKGDAKSQITVQHTKLTNAVDAEARKAYWGEKLEALQKYSF